MIAEVADAMCVADQYAKDRQLGCGSVPKKISRSLQSMWVVSKGRARQGWPLA